MLLIGIQSSPGDYSITVFLTESENSVRHRSLVFCCDSQVGVGLMPAKLGVILNVQLCLSLAKSWSTERLFYIPCLGLASQSTLIPKCGSFCKNPEGIFWILAEDSATVEDRA